MKGARRAGAAAWIAALLATVVIAGYQRRTGPTWPVPVEIHVGGSPVSGRLVRSHPGAGGAVVALTAPDPAIGGELVWRRFPTGEPWRSVGLVRGGGALSVELPHLPPAGKLEYQLRLKRSGSNGPATIVPANGPVIVRYRGDVPAWVLIPHILAMFLGLAVGVRALLGAVIGEQDLRRLVPWALALLVPGGLVLGPLVQKHAFGAYWTGWPVGDDLTDTKTLVAVVAWVVAWWLGRNWPRLQRAAVVVAALVLLAVYLVPHSARGSQLDWSKVPDNVGAGLSPRPAATTKAGRTQRSALYISGSSSAPTGATCSLRW
jgi:hypothetical protein